MTRDDIIRMAREVGIIIFEDASLTTDDLAPFAALVASAERDACAAMCEQLGVEGYGTLAIAAAIRQRGSK